MNYEEWPLSVHQGILLAGLGLGEDVTTLEEFTYLIDYDNEDHQEILGQAGFLDEIAASLGIRDEIVTGWFNRNFIPEEARWMITEIILENNTTEA
jgi:hypothetical protein